MSLANHAVLLQMYCNVLQDYFRCSSLSYGPFGSSSTARFIPLQHGQVIGSAPDVTKLSFHISFGTSHSCITAKNSFSRPASVLGARYQFTNPISDSSPFPLLKATVPTSENQLLTQMFQWNRSVHIVLKNLIC